MDGLPTLSTTGPAGLAPLADFRLPLALVEAVTCDPKVRSTSTLVVKPDAVFCSTDGWVSCRTPDLRDVRWQLRVPKVAWMAAAGDALLVHAGDVHGGLVHVLAAATGKERGRVDTPRAAIRAVTVPGDRLLMELHDGSGCICIEAATARTLWTLGLPPRSGFYGSHQMVSGAVGLADGFAIGPTATGTVMRLDGDTGTVRWEVGLPMLGPDAKSPACAWALNLSSPATLLCRSIGDVLRLALADGRVVQQRPIRRGSQFVTTERLLFEIDRTWVSVIDTVTLDEVKRLDWSNGLRSSGVLGYPHALAVSTRGIVWAPGDSRMLGAYWPGRRGGRRLVWTHEFEGYVTAITAMGPYVYVVVGPLHHNQTGSGGRPGLYCFGSADIVERPSRDWSRPWRLAEERRARWLARRPA